MPRVVANHGITYHHEDMSLRMIEYMVDENNIEIERDDMHFIQQIIVGAKEYVLCCSAGDTKVSRHVRSDTNP